VKKEAARILGSTLVTHQTGPKGKQVNRLYIEDGSAIEKEFYLSMLVDRETSRVAIVVSTDMEEVAKIAHRALVLDRGAIVAELSGVDLTIAHLVAAASELRDSNTHTPSNRRTES